MTVLLKGLGGVPDAKKFYDFDQVTHSFLCFLCILAAYLIVFLSLCHHQVFGGSEGNTQADVFKDTKHLIMSVVDGYNVCIFAYGQTGAGKVTLVICCAS